MLPARLLGPARPSFFVLKGITGITFNYIRRRLACCINCCAMPWLREGAAWGGLHGGCGPLRHVFEHFFRHLAFSQLLHIIRIYA